MTSSADDNVAVDDATESTSKLTLQDENSAQPSSKQSTPLRQPAPPIHQRNISADSSQNDGKSKSSGPISNGFGDDVEVAKSEVSSQASSQQSRSKSSQTTSGGADGTRRTTKVYYHIDDETTPYCTEVPVPADRITLGDFKRVLNRSNFKFYCKAIDQEVGGEVKAEIRDDNQLLHKSLNGQFELFLLTAEGSSHSDGTSTAGFSKPGNSLGRHSNMVPGPAPSSFYPFQSSSHNYHHSRMNNGRQFGLELGHRNRRVGAGGIMTPFEDSTIYTESDARLFSDDESRVSTSTDNITSVSRQHHNLYRRRRRQYHRRQPSRASSMSSMTETSMALEVITVTLNMDTVNFLGISIVGQSCSRGDNGIYVANVMPGGAVALDGRVEPGDMILQVNDISFENFTNDQAVEVLKEAVNKRGPIKLTVAKSFDGGRSNYFMVPSREPVRPIDTQAWVQHTNAVRGIMGSIPEGSEGAPTPIPGQYPSQQTNHHFNGQMGPGQGVRPGTSSSTTATSNGSGGGQTTVVGPGGTGMPYIAMPPPQEQLSIHTDKRLVVQTMAMPNSGLDVRNRTWLKIPIPMSFLGSALIDWLMEHVDGLRDRKDCRKYASELLKEKLIAHVVNKITFTEQCYYVFGEQCAEFVRLRTASEEGSARGGYQQQQMPLHATIASTSGNGWVNQQQPHMHQIARSMVSEYASMPPMPSPYPGQPQQQYNMTGGNPYFQQAQIHHQINQHPRVGGPDSQASNNSNEGGNSSSGGGSSEQNRRKAVLPPAPSVSSSVPIHPGSVLPGGGQHYTTNQGRLAGQQPHPAIFMEERSEGKLSRFRIRNYNEDFFVDHL